MKSPLVAAAGLALALTASTPASADTRNFTLVNSTEVGITAVYFSVPEYAEAFAQAGLSKWVRSDGVSYLAAGYEGRIGFNNTGPCDLQLRVDFDNGYHSEWNRGFDFCSVSIITIWYDFSTRTVRARYQ